MPTALSIGIVLPSNVKGGPQKYTAIIANDLARNGHNVTIFISVLSHYYLLVTLGKRRKSWLKSSLRQTWEWVGNREFCFQELLDVEELDGRVEIKFVPRRASKAQLAGLDCLILQSEAQVVEYQQRYPQEQQLFMFWHPAEHSHGNESTFKKVRREFNGTTVVTSPFAAREIADDIQGLPVVPAPVSEIFWDQRLRFDRDADRKDVLLFWKDYQDGPKGSDMVKKLLESRPETSVTVWCRGPGFSSMAAKSLPETNIVENLTESELRDLYLGHSLLLFNSTYEGFGIPPTESLVCGCIPILLPQVGAAEIYARDGENSIYLNGDVETAAQRMADVLDNPQLLQTMRESASDPSLPFDPNGCGERLLKAGGVIY